MLSTKTSNNAHGQDSSYFLGWQAYEENPYHPVSNPSGIIQMGLAENQLSFDVLESWLANNPDAIGLTKKGKFLFRELALFQDYHGLPAFKNALVEFMSDIRGNRVTFDPNKLVLTAGSTSANETLMFCLAEPGEAFLIPTPYYPGFDRDLKWRTGAKIVPIHCHSSNGFRITKPALEEAYHRAQTLLNLRVKGVLITNPSNPLGTTASFQELRDLIAFAAAKQIHLVSDEIYSGTAFDSPRFIGISEALSDLGLQGSQVWRRTHVVYSLSKDLGLPGFRLGVLYSNDEAVVSAATKMSSFGLVSSQTQFLMASMLADRGFRRAYIEENKDRLRRRRGRLVSGLRDAGIGCLEGNAGLFCWADIRHLLRSDTVEGEMELWRKIVEDVGLNISPGSSCHCGEPGWFRVCFANVPRETLDVALQRIKAFVAGARVDAAGGGKWVQRLSLCDRAQGRCLKMEACLGEGHFV